MRQCHFGQKTGAGWYRYEPGSRAMTPNSRPLSSPRRRRTPVRNHPTTIGQEEIVERTVYALINEEPYPRGGHRFAGR